MKLYKFQEEELEATKDKNKVAYYLDMGLGKTFIGAEKAISLGNDILLICQKSKINDWIEHFKSNYDCEDSRVIPRIYNLTNKKEFEQFLNNINEANKPNEIYDDWTGQTYNELSLDPCTYIGVINYELAFRRPELLQLTDFTLMLDESSMIQNETAKRSKFIMKLKFKNLILLSGTPCSGKYDRLLSQINMLGWRISEDLFYKQYVEFHYDDNNGFPLRIVDGYKNVDRLKQKLREHGCRFLKTEEVFDLPKQNFNNIYIDTTKEYKKFKKDRIVDLYRIDKNNITTLIDNSVIFGDLTLVGDTTLTKMLYERQLCGQYNQDKLEALKDILSSTEDRLIVFYNFNEELRQIEDVCLELDKPVSIVNGQEKDLSCYEEYENSVTLIQYQAGAMGLNLQKANKIIYFTPPLSSELFEQSKKRIHRIGQEHSCFYYKLVCKNSIEEKIYKTLEMYKNYTNELFEEDK